MRQNERIERKWKKEKKDASPPQSNVLIVSMKWYAWISSSQYTSWLEVSMSGIYARVGKEKMGVAILSYLKSHHIRNSLEELLVQLNLKKLSQRERLRNTPPIRNNIRLQGTCLKKTDFLMGSTKTFPKISKLSIPARTLSNFFKI